MRMFAAMYTLLVKATFAAAHRIPGHQGDCRHLHGHTYRVEAEFQHGELDELGMGMDFAVLKKELEAILPDHTYLNDELDGPTTAEGLSKWIFDQLRARELPVSAVTVWESDRCGCRYTDEAPTGS